MAAITANMAISLRSELTKPVKVEYIDGNLFSMDNAGNTIHVYTFYDGQPQEISGSISANVIRADGSTVAVSGAKEGNRAYVILPQAAYAVPGVCTIVVKATDGTTVTTIAALVANVYMSSTDTPVDPGTIIPSVQNLIAAIDAAVASIPADYSALLAAVAKEYSSSSIYPFVGMVVWQGGELMKNKVSIAEGETFDPDKWEAANVGSTVNQLLCSEKQFSAAVDAITGAEPIVFEYGYMWATVSPGEVSTKTETSAYACAKFPVTEGEKITLNATGITGNYRLWCFLDADGKVITRASTSLSGKRTITAPEGAVECVINNRLISQQDGFYAYRGTAVQDALAETNESVDEISELIPAGYVSAIDRTVTGITMKTSGDTITMYGQPEAVRWWALFNGADSVRTANASFLKTFEPGTYYFNMTGAGAKPTFSLVATYATVNDGWTLLNTDNPSVKVTFTDPANVLLVIPATANYGTEESPTTYTVTIKKLSAIDYTARDMKQTLAQAFADVATKAPAITETASGHIAQFADGADMPLQKVTAYISETQAGAGEASPENIREITGRTVYRVNACGRNLFGGERFAQSLKASLPAATIDESEGKVTFPGGTAISAQYPYVTDYCGLTGQFKANTVYTIVLSGYKNNTNTSANLDVVYTDGTSQHITGLGTTKTTTSHTTTAGKTVQGIRKYYSGGTTVLYYDECAIVEGSIPRQGAIKGALYEIALPTEAGTVYGGILEINADGSGTLTVTRGMYVFDGADSIGSVAESSTGIMAMSSTALTDNVTEDETLLSNQYATAVIAPPESGTAVQSTTGAIIVYDNRFVDAETSAALCEANPVQVTYQLATPVVYNFTPGQVRSVLGENNIWAEQGTVTVKYGADTKLYIDAAIAAALNT